MLLRKILIFGLNLVLLLPAAPGRAQSSQPTEYQLKAAFLYNFAQFIDWPPEAFADDKTPFVFGILGDNPFGSDLERIVAGKKINDRPISVQVFHTADEAAHCQILFVSKSEKKHFPEIIQGLHGDAVLTVSETDGFIQTGGMINFLLVGGKIRFQIDDAAAKAAKLKISSKLLSLAAASPH